MRAMALFAALMADTVVANFYTKHPGVACDGRNEILGGGTGYTREECQAVCNASPLCVSIEFGVGDNVGGCQASTSCKAGEWTTGASAGEWDVYVREVSFDGMAASLVALTARVAELEQQNQCLQWQVEADSQLCVGSLSKTNLTGIQILA